jgi:hypothetical protein
MTAAELVRRLGDHGATCPRAPGAVYFQDGDRGLRLRCITGCDVEAIAAALPS